MSKATPAALIAHCRGAHVTPATLFKVTLVNGTVKAFTDLDVDIVYPLGPTGVRYLASSYTKSAVQTSSAFNVDTLQLQGILKLPAIVEADLLAGVWDYALFEKWMVNYEDLSMGHEIVRRGHLGEISTGGLKFEAELRGMLQAYSRTIGRLYQASCDADLFDSRCKLDRLLFTVTGTLDAVAADNRTLTDAARTEAAGYFNGGKITFTSGANNTLSMEVKTSVVGSLVLHQPMPYLIEQTATYSLEPGCDKLMATCQTKFGVNNIVNFRGKPHLPGLDKMMAVGGR